MIRQLVPAIAACFFIVQLGSANDALLIEAESFAQPGGWVLDTQSIEIMGSPYLLAHGLGRPVADATCEVTVPSTGTYHVFVRTKDWVARWNAPGQPGRFQLLVNGQPLTETFGTRGKDWFWHDGGTVEIPRRKVTLALHDLTGFEGRCDAIFLTKEAGKTPPNENEVLPSWRRKLLGLPPQPVEKSGYDLVVVGGGYAGTAAAISAARLGCRVALIQNRPVLGGNGSSEIRVWAQGLIRRGKFPRVGEIVEELTDHATKSPGRAEEFGDAKKEALVRAEKNLDLMLNHHVYAVETDDDRISAVLALDTRTSRQTRIRGRLFADCTGHATVGFLAGADWEMKPDGRMGMSNMWAWEETDKPVDFPETPWALDLDMEDFPYPRDHHGQWFWESGFDKDPLAEAETIRDWNLRAVYGAFNAMKNRGGREQHRNARLTWIAYIGGVRESRRLLGDVLLTRDDVVDKRVFPDGVVPSTWSIDLHYPNPKYAGTYAENPFISVAEFDTRVDRVYGYPVPYRCFYSRNIQNLFMAGRCISVTHEALGTTRVMKTGGMMGEVVGKAASLCTLHECWPEHVFEPYWNEFEELLRLPGKARRATVNDPISIPDDIPIARAEGPPSGLDPSELDGIVIDEQQALRSGPWQHSVGLKGYVGYGYLYASPNSGASIKFVCSVPESGNYEVRLAYQPHENRATNAPITVQTPSTKKRLAVNMQRPAELENGFQSLGVFHVEKGEQLQVILSTKPAGGATKVDGMIHADAVQLIRQ
jgi:hypothetical protein